MIGLKLHAGQVPGPFTIINQNPFLSDKTRLIVNPNPP
jgi:hypothetical protein